MVTSISSVGMQQVASTNVLEGQNVESKNQPTKEQPSFKSKSENDQFVKSYEVEATTGKKWGVGLASTFIPGLGQAINGDWGKGIAFFLGTSALGVASNFAALSGRIGLSLVGVLATLGLGVASIVDAVKSAKSTVQVVDQEALKTNGNPI